MNDNLNQSLMEDQKALQLNENARLIFSLEEGVGGDQAEFNELMTNQAVKLYQLKCHLRVASECKIDIHLVATDSQSSTLKNVRLVMMTADA